MSRGPGGRCPWSGGCRGWVCGWVGEAARASAPVSPHVVGLWCGLVRVLAGRAALGSGLFGRDAGWVVVGLGTAARCRPAVPHPRSQARSSDPARPPGRGAACPSPTPPWTPPSPRGEPGPSRESGAARVEANPTSQADPDRFLRLAPDFNGSMRITGQLPVADAALLSAQLDALMPAASTHVHTGEAPSMDARRADALVLLTQHAAGSGQLPSHGVDRPQVHITLDFDMLKSGLGEVSLLGAGGTDGLSAGEARRLACDAGLIPMVLGTTSRRLDVGRTHRLFTPAIRAALTERDKGCVFPGCTAPPAACEAHHILPWWAGGASCLANGVLLGPFHHRLVEPDPLQSEDSQWQVHLDPATGLPWVTPPRHIDPARRPRQHQRHRLQQLTPRVAGPPCPHDPDPPDPDGLGPDPSRAPFYTGPGLDELIRRSAAVWAKGG
ncbi:MAG TPA: DUF222 domain-containing protein [Arachnia sp.]|nr:DUF222 domain-containing protein [Arachnia sp.]